MRRLLTAIFVTCLLAAPVAAFAQVPDDAGAAVAAVDAGPVAVEAAAAAELPTAGDAASGLVEALGNGQWFLVLGFGLILVVWVARALLAGWDWAQTRLGGWVLIFAVSFVGTVGIGLSAGTGFSWGLVASAVTAALTATAARKAAKDPGRPPSGDDVIGSSITSGPL